LIIQGIATHNHYIEPLHYQRVNEIINGKRGITPSTALRLAKFFRVSPDFWINIQLRWDLYFARKSELDALKMIKPLPAHQIQMNKSSAQNKP